MNYFLSPENIKTIPIDIAQSTYHIDAVENIDTLIEQISDEEFNLDERLPYWATLWPSAIALAEYISLHVNCYKKDVLELGCGLGLNGVVCGKLGATVTMTDYEIDSLTFAKQNAIQNQLSSFSTKLVDWRSPNLEGTYDIIIAADVLYEDRFLSPVRDMITTYLKPSGTAFIAEPNRTVAMPFFDGLTKNGFSYKQFKQRIQYKGIEHLISIYEIN